MVVMTNAMIAKSQEKQKAHEEKMAWYKEQSKRLRK